MDFAEIKGIAEDHPVATGAVIFVGGVLILYMLGYIGGGSAASASSNNAGVAAAYYNAEAAQTVAGTQLQIAQANNTAATAQAQIAADAATKINAAQVAGATAINQSNNQAVVAETYNTNALGVVQAQVAGDTAVKVAYNTNALGVVQSQDSLLASIYHMIVPTELANGGNASFNTTAGTFNVAVAPTPAPVAPTPIVVNNYAPYTPPAQSGLFPGLERSDGVEGGLGGGEANF